MESGEPKVPLYEVEETVDQRIRLLSDLASEIQDQINNLDVTDEQKLARAREMVQDLNEQLGENYVGEPARVVGTYLLLTEDSDGDFEITEECGQRNGQLTEFSYLIREDDEGRGIAEIGHRVFLYTEQERDTFRTTEVDYFLFAPVKKSTVISSDEADKQDEQLLHEQLPERPTNEQFIELVSSVDEGSHLQRLGQLFDALRLQGVTEKQLDAYMSYAEHALGLRDTYITVLPQYYVEYRVNVAIPVQHNGPVRGRIAGLSLAQHFQLRNEEFGSLPYKDVAIALEINTVNGPGLLHVPLTGLISYELI